MAGRLAWPNRRAYRLIWVVVLAFCSWCTAVGLRAQHDPVYLDKYTITKVYFEGSEQLNRYYIFSYLQFKEGDTFTPAELEKHIKDTRYIMRTQWYFQADFETRYYADGRVEVYVILEPSPKRLSFLGALPDGHSVYIGFSGERRSPGSAFRWHVGKTMGLSWYFPYIANSFFGLNFIMETEIEKQLERLSIDDIGNALLWMRGGMEEFIQPDFAIKLGLAQQYWGTLDFSTNGLVNEVIIGAFADFNSLYLLKSRLWGMQFYLRTDAGVLTSLFMLRSQYKLLLLPVRWLELGLYLSGIASVLERWHIGALNAEIPGIDIENEDYDFNALSRLRTTIMLSHNDYDGQHSEFNAGFALEGKFGLYAGLFDTENLQPFELGFEVQGGLVIDVLSPGALTTRFYFMAGASLLDGLPVAEFMVETRH